MTDYTPDEGQTSFPNVHCTGSDTWTFGRHLARVRVRQTFPDVNPATHRGGYWFVTVDGRQAGPGGPRVDPGLGSQVLLAPPPGNTVVRVSKWPPTDHRDLEHYMEPAAWEALHTEYGFPHWYSLEILDHENDPWPAGTPTA